jgi:hypothetical protein
VKTLLSPVVGHQKPPWPDRYQHIGSISQRGSDVINKVDPEGDVLNIDVHEVVAESLSQPSVDPLCVVGCVIPPVAEKHTTYSLGPSLKALGQKPLNSAQTNVNTIPVMSIFRAVALSMSLFTNQATIPPMNANTIGAIHHAPLTVLVWPVGGSGCLGGVAPCDDPPSVGGCGA